MNKKTLKITQGAMMVAIFGMLLLLNRQTAGLFEGVLFFILPIPMVAYSALYGWKPGLTVFAAMSLISMLFGTVMTMFYAITQCIVGLVFGSMLYKKIDLTKTLFVVMGLSAISSVLELIITAVLFGYSINDDVNELSNVMSDAFTKAGVELPAVMLGGNYLRQMFIISTIFWGMVSGYVIFQLSLIILKRLKFPVQKPKSVFSYYPPKIIGVICFVLFIAYNFSLAKPQENPVTENVLQALGVSGYLYLIVFGVMAIILWCRLVFKGNKLITFVIVFLGIFLLPQATMLMGVFYSAGSLHESLMRDLGINRNED